MDLLDELLQVAEAEAGVQYVLTRDEAAAEEAATDAEVIASQAAAAAAYPGLTLAQAREAERQFRESLARLEAAREEAEELGDSVVNPETGRYVRLGSREYRGLVRRGWRLDGRRLIPERVAVVQGEVERVLGVKLNLPSATSEEILSDLELEVERAEAAALRDRARKMGLADAEIARVLVEAGLGEETLTDEEIDALLEEAMAEPAEERELGGVEVDDGRVVWYVPLAGSTAEVRREVSGALDARTRYRCYIRTVARDAFDAPDHVPDSWVLGADRGLEVTQYWRPFGLGPSPYGSDITPGKVESVEAHLKDTARGYVTGWLLALVPAGEGNAAWLAMREGAANCVHAAVREALKEAAAKKGKPLPNSVLAPLDGFAKRVERSGATEEELGWLCRQLKRCIQLRDLEDGILWEPTNAKGEPTYRGNGPPIVIYRANAHGFRSANPDVPKPEKLKVFDLPDMAGMKVAEATETMARSVSDYIRSEGIVRAYQVGASLIDADTKTLHRPERTNAAIERLEEDAGLVVDDGFRGRMDNLHLGGAQSYAFKLWREKSGVRSLAREGAIREAWRAANFEAVPWYSGEGLGGATCVDMRAAYLACDKRSHKATGPSHEWAKVHGFPRGDVQRRAAVTDLREVEGLRGCVRFRELKLSDDCPTPIRAQIAAHLEKKGPWLTVPMALYMRDRGLIREHVLEQVVYSLGHLDGLEWPERDLAVRFVGSCKYASKRQTFWTRDGAEADYYAERYGASIERPWAKQWGLVGPAPKPFGEGNLLRVTYSTGKERQDHSYIRAYVLGYMFIGVAEAILGLSPGVVLACKVDSLTLKEGHALTGAFPKDHPKDTLLYGSWRGCDVPEPTTTAPRRAPEAFDAEKGAPVERLSDDALSRHRLSYLDGQGGSGKSYRACRAFPGRRVEVLGKDNWHLQQLRDPETNPHGYPALTYHEYFHLGSGKHGDWTPEVMGKKKPDVVIWDEVGCVPAEFLQKALNWLARVRAIVVLAGDPEGQLPAFGDTEGGRKIRDAIRRYDPYEETMTEDWRAKGCAGLQSVKRRAWRKSEEEQLRVLRELPFVSLEECLRQWSPGDMVAVLGKPTGEALAPLFERERLARFPGEPVRWRFRPTKERRETAYRKKGGKLPLVLAPSGARVPAIVGIQVSAPADSRAPGPDWVRDYWTTVSSLQSRTVKAPGRLIVIDDLFGSRWQREKCPNAVYTVLSRPERLEQLVVVTRQVARSSGGKSAFGLEDVY